MPPRIEEAEPQKSRVRAENKPRRAVPTMRVILTGLGVAAALLVSVFAFQRLEQFLIGDGRFALKGPEVSSETATLEISGANHAARKQIESVFADDAGRSVYLMPLSERRASIRSVDWVKDATVARMWPNHVVVSVKERKPVAFVTLDSSRVALIDEEGVILPPVADHFPVPVLIGIHSADPIAKRQDRVTRMLRLTHDLGEQAGKISEIDVTDRENLKVREPRDGQMLTLLLGDRNFNQRYKNFESHYPEIKRRLTDANTFDLRLEDRITVVE